MPVSHPNSEPANAAEINGDSFLPLLIALSVMLLLLPLLEPWPLLMSLIASVVLLTGLLAVLRDRSFRAVVIGALAVCLPLRWMAHFWGNSAPVLLVLSHATVGITFAILEIVVLVRVMAQPRVTRQSVFGAICGYLMLGYLFAFVYAVLTYFNPSALNIGGQSLGVEHAANVQRRLSELAYFSFVTLTTVGYGDIAPVSPVARSMAVLEALAGQLYLAAFVARLIGAMSSSNTDPAQT